MFRVIEEYNSKSMLLTELNFLKLPSDDPQQRQPDLSKTLEVLDWFPQTALHDGLFRTIPYFTESLRQGIDTETWSPL